MSPMINDSTYWRAFDENKVSHSVAHYLMAIDHLRSEQGYARVTDVAGLMNISRGAASLALSHLKEKGLVEEDPNRFLLLSEEGNSLARTIEHNFVLLTCFFENVLGMDPKIARADACKIEHLLSDESSKALIRFLRALLSKKDLIQELSQSIQNAADACEGDESCPLCESSGECLMPHTDRFQRCPLLHPSD